MGIERGQSINEAQLEGGCADNITAVDPATEEMLNAIQAASATNMDDTLAAASAGDISAGLRNGTADYAAKDAGWGFDLLTISNDVQRLSSAPSKV